jgi:chromosome segregation ATPase
MNIFLATLFPRVSRDLVRLRESLEQPKTNKAMARLSTEEEVEVINNAIAALEANKATIASLREQLADLPEQNEALKTALQAAEDADATTDDALSGLKDAVEAANS